VLKPALGPIDVGDLVTWKLFGSDVHWGVGVVLEVRDDRPRGPDAAIVEVAVIRITNAGNGRALTSVRVSELERGRR
jgi:hypothetical protein